MGQQGCQFASSTPAILKRLIFHCLTRLIILVFKYSKNEKFRNGHWTITNISKLRLSHTNKQPYSEREICLLSKCLLM